VAKTFDPALGSDLDWVRLLIGDKDVATAKLSDEEIRAILTESENNRYSAAALAGELLLTKAGGVTSKTVDDLSITYSDNPEGAYRNYLGGLRIRGLVRRRGVMRILGDQSDR
jgi:hypothetical protein